MAELVLDSVAVAAAALDHATDTIRAAEVAQCLAIAALCDLHEVDESVLVDGCERWVPGGADGTPPIGEFVIGEIAGLLGAGIGATVLRIHRVLNLRHRHPTLWTLVVTGDIRAHEAFLVADAAAAAKLDADACSRFDRMCAHALALQPWARVKGQLERWLVKADPTQAAANAAAAAGRRRVDLGPVTDGHVGLWGQLDAADGLALDDALNHLAENLDGETIDHRRASALGLMARSVLGQDTLPTNGVTRTAEIVVRLHSTDLADPSNGTAHLAGWGHVLLSQLGTILTGCQVTVRPIVIDTSLPAVDGYQIPDQMRRVLEERNPVDVFPWGTRTAGSCQADHTIPYQAGLTGQTHLGNLGPLSSFTHRLKTHGGWHLEQPTPGLFLWRSPLGYQYAVTAAGTIRIGKPEPPQHRWWHQEPPQHQPPDDLGPPGRAGTAPIPPDPGERQTPLPYVA